MKNKLKFYWRALKNMSYLRRLGMALNILSVTMLLIAMGISLYMGNYAVFFLQGGCLSFVLLCATPNTLAIIEDQRLREKNNEKFSA